MTTTTTTTQEQMDRIIYSYHYDPFQVLGFHNVTIEGKQRAVIRTFHPEAKKIVIKTGRKKIPMFKTHHDGMFETVLENPAKITYNYLITSWEDHSWELDDPYIFSPVLSDFDLHLFNEGNHLEAYKKLGAHQMTHEGKDGVHFAVWAPNAKRVSVIGDFNRWDGRRSPMRVRGSSGIWELFIPGLTQGECYKYEIKGQDDSLIEKADPYAFFSELRPKTASIVYEIGNYSWNDTAYLKKRDSTNFINQPISIYEVHMGSWKRKEGNTYLTYRELADELVDYVDQMGFTHIELMPVTEYPFDGSWGYQVTGYFAPTSRFGTPDDFKYFVDTCHRKGIGVLMDWVPAHFPRDKHGLARFDGTALYEHEDPRKGFHKDWTTFIFNYGRNEVRNFLIANALFWLEEYHLDGLRVDAVASMLYLDYAREDDEWIPNEYGGNENLDAVHFLKSLNETVYTKHPGVLMIAEESTAWTGVSRPTYVGGLGFGLKWNMGWMNDFLYYMQKEPIHRKYHHNDLTFSMIYAFNENFILVLSHDEVVHGKQSLLSKMPGDDWQKFANLRCSMGFMFAHPGKKLNFMGGEFGQWREWTEKQSLDWHLLNWEHHRQLQHYFKSLNRIYRENSPLFELDFSGEGFCWINCNDWESSVLSFLRKDKEGNTIVAVVNFTPVVRHNYRVGVPEHCHWEEFFNSDSAEFGGSNIGNWGGFWSDEIPWDNQRCSLSLTLPPLGIVLFKPNKEC